MPQVYEPEFKRKLVRLHLEEGRSYKSLTQEYGVSKSAISKWVELFSNECQKKVNADPTALNDADLMKENLRLRKELETSYEAQVSHYTEFIKSKSEWQMVEVYADDGISGTNTAKRDEFNCLIADCEAGKIDLILTKSISRFSRNTLDCLKYTRKLKALNIAVFFEKENINTMDSKGEVLLTIMASLAQQESESLSANVRMGIQYRNQQGKVRSTTTGS